MAARNSPAVRSTVQGLVIERIFHTPRGLVWRAWTDPEQVMRWWGPKGYTAPVCKIDLRVGGTFLYCMRSPEGIEYWNTGVFQEIVPLEKIVCTDSFADQTGKVVPATYYGFSPDFPLELLMTVTFEDLAGKTRLTLRHTGLPAGEIQESARAGWNESLDKFARALDELRLT
jgi:uncharacterized protein YndB with AHSA1/START domain